MKKSRYKSYILLGVLFVAWFFSADHVISIFDTNDSAKSVDFTSFKQKNDILGSIESMTATGDMMETISIRGWAFAETEQSNANRRVSLVLKNEQNCYELNFTTPNKGGSLYEWYIERDDIANTYSHKKLFSNAIGFIGDFSTYNIANGSYEVYIYCWENEVNYGIVHSRKIIEKNESSITIAPWRSSVVTLDTSQVAHDSKFSVDNIAFSDGIITISGWALLKDKDASIQNAYVSVNGVMYTTIKVARQDLVDGYKNEKYKMGGIRASFSTEDIPNKLEIQILLEENGIVYALPSVTFEKQDDIYTKKAN